MGAILAANVFSLLESFRCAKARDDIALTRIPLKYNDEKSILLAADLPFRASFVPVTSNQTFFMMRHKEIGKLASTCRD